MDGLGLVEWIGQQPECVAPYHLADWCSLIERSLREPVRGLCAVPIRHFKTTTTQYGIAWLLKRDPTLRLIVMTHSDDRAMGMGKDIREVCMGAGVGPVGRGDNTIRHWSNPDGGGVAVMSAVQSRLGEPCDILIVDDPIGGAVEADASDVRQAVDHSIAHYTARCGRAGRPGSVLVIMSPWHPDDPIGRRVRRTAVKWELHRHAAILDEGLETERAFAPNVRTLVELKQIRAELKESDPTERLWFAQFQCDPRGQSGDLFRQPARYATIPTYGGFRIVEGVDLAYSVGRHADWFARVLLKVFGSIAYVLEVERSKLDLDSIAAKLIASQSEHGSHPIYSYMSGPEIGYAHWLAERGVLVSRLPARFNKHVRAQKTIARWNDGKILTPAGPSMDAFLSRVGTFRGLETDDDDDEIDALVSAHDGGVGQGAGVQVKTLGTWRL